MAIYDPRPIVTECDEGWDSGRCRAPTTIA